MDSIDARSGTDPSTLDFYDFQNITVSGRKFADVNGDGRTVLLSEDFTGGLGGFIPPLVMGAVYSAKNHSSSIGLMLLSDLALAGCVYAYGRIRTAGTAPTESRYFVCSAYSTDGRRSRFRKPRGRWVNAQSAWKSAMTRGSPKRSAETRWSSSTVGRCRRSSASCVRTQA